MGIAIEAHRRRRFAARSFYEQHKEGLPVHTREGASVCTASAGIRGGEKGSARRRCNFSFLKSFLLPFFKKEDNSFSK